MKPSRAAWFLFLFSVFLQISLRKQVALAVNSQSKLCYLLVSTIFAGEKKQQYSATMKYILQLGIILAISFVGEVLNRVIPLPVPASIYGMAILFTALCTGVIKLQAVRETGKFLISLLPLMFIPPTVGLIDNWGTMQEFLLPIIIISIVSTVVVIAVAGHVTQFIINKKKGGKG